MTASRVIPVKGKERIMQVPPEIVAKNVRITPDIDRLITRGIARLEKACDYIISTHIALELEQGRHVKGNPYHMRIDVQIPNRPTIIVQRSSKPSTKVQKDPGSLGAQPLTKSEIETKESQYFLTGVVGEKKTREEILPSLIRRSFDSARRELEKVVDRQRGDIKTHPEQQIQAVVEEIFHDQDHGFLQTLDGQRVYFHKNSVLHKGWDRLTPGAIVRYVLEIGDKGLQASTVDMVNKPGASEMHDRLHELS
jgi:cold shock CspA family protein/ribosome-associated translation inhibitor RaiA